MSPASKKSVGKLPSRTSRKLVPRADQVDSRSQAEVSEQVIAALPAPSHTMTQASLVEYLGASAVTELVVVEAAPGRYRIEATLSWRSGKSMLVAARGERIFQSLDTVATLLKTIGIGPTLVRLELLA